MVPRLCVARSASVSAPGIGVVEAFIRGKGVSRCRQDVSARLVKELPAKEGQSVTKDVRREGLEEKDDHACFTGTGFANPVSCARARARHICLAIAINSSRVDSMAVFVTSANLIRN